MGTKPPPSRGSPKSSAAGDSEGSSCCLRLRLLHVLTLAEPALRLGTLLRPGSEWEEEGREREEGEEG